MKGEACLEVGALNKEMKKKGGSQIRFFFAVGIFLKLW